MTALMIFTVPATNPVAVAPVPRFSSLSRNFFRQIENEMSGPA